jgi:hypothetical protein
MLPGRCRTREALGGVAACGCTDGCAGVPMCSMADPVSLTPMHRPSESTYNVSLMLLTQQWAQRYLHCRLLLLKSVG